jgi:acetyltransferase-like isoleucine patch superfamily enzyme
MRKALGEIGWGGAWRFLLGTLARGLLAVCVAPQLRALLLRLFGARLGRDCIVHPVRFFNVYRTGFRGLRLGDNVFVGDDCLLDLAGEIHLEANATLAERVTLLTHTNVGYRDHPLQAHFPPVVAPVTIRSGSFVGAGATVLPGVTIGPEAFVAAGSVVGADVGRRELVAGVPARVVRRIGEP